LRSQPTEPNFDPQGEELCETLLDVIGRHGDVEGVVIALDAPLHCRERPGQPARRKAVARGESAGSLQRESERALRAYARALDSGHTRWSRDLRIQAGSPVPCRIARVLARLEAAGHATYHGGAASNGVVEVFPSEAIWALGILGGYPGCDSRWVREYKAKKPRRLEVVAAREVARRPLGGFMLPLCTGGLGRETVGAWLDAIADAAVLCATGRDGDVRKSKAFDDEIDSGIAFLTAAAFALGESHVWGDGSDGTIVGPGRLPTATASE
jgi:hypothetical protein